MKVLLTGASGMVGKNILEHHAMRAHELLLPSSEELNLLEKQEVNAYIHHHKPEFVIHAAGRVGGIEANMASPVCFLVDNVQIGLNLIAAARENGVTQFMNMGSSCMYPRNASNPLSEDLILKGELEPTNEGYALAKTVSTRLCEYVSRENNRFLYKTVIPCNLYGRHDKFDPKYSHMIPAVIKKLSDAKNKYLKSVDIWGDGTARREFMYCADFADFVTYALDNFEKMPQNINVGLGHDHTINEYYKVVAEVVGFDGVFTHDLSKPIGMKQKLVDVTKLNAFGWEPKTTLRSGVAKTLEFYMENIDE